jgi:hypothetical protein
VIAFQSQPLVFRTMPSTWKRFASVTAQPRKPFISENALTVLLCRDAVKWSTP